MMHDGLIYVLTIRPTTTNGNGYQSPKVAYAKVDLKSNRFLEQFILRISHFLH